ncbi:MAG: hypothetical protein CVV29_02555 [Methanobacteriales archaeon HGW-Methanobacteriales-2]|nr:MAG: hypothetical protein CVV29_02555 [Methanobacteriales archaeon HGW-Methanobacteriales-2]
MNIISGDYYQAKHVKVNIFNNILNNYKFNNQQLKIAWNDLNPQLNTYFFNKKISFPYKKNQD